MEEILRPDKRQSRHWDTVTNMEVLQNGKQQEVRSVETANAEAIKENAGQAAQ